MCLQILDVIRISPLFEKIQSNREVSIGNSNDFLSVIRISVIGKPLQLKQIFRRYDKIN